MTDPKPYTVAQHGHELELLTTAEFLVRLRETIERAGGQRALAKTLGTTSNYLWQVLDGRRPPSAKVLGACGCERLEFIAITGEA